MKSLQIQSKIKDYSVSFESNFNFFDNLSRITEKVVIIDKVVFDLYREIFTKKFDQLDIIMVEAIEENKTLDYTKSIYEILVKKNAKKNLNIISIGGGITQDITGFVASTLYRGVNWIYVPTTFLAQTDSCIGSKTSLNFQSHKNLIGTFYPPTQIYINTSFLNTLSEVDFFSGIGETIKFQLMKEIYPKDFKAIAEAVNRATGKESLVPLIFDNMQVKLSYMASDEFDQGRRNLLNYGHCFGHAIETTSNYYIPHGLAVTIGIIFANAISKNRLFLSTEVYDFLNKNLLLPNIPLKLKKEHFNMDILKSMKSDKKRVGEHLTVVIPDEEFRLTKVDNVTESEFIKSFDETVNILFGSK